MSGLRVIAGKARGRRLRSVPGDTTRPITDRTKEALFNIIGPDIQGSTMLDLFGGTGSVGIEALSRGAAFVQFVELNRLAVRTIQDNLKTTGFGERARVSRADAFDYLARRTPQPFDYVYIAPPQYRDMWRQALVALDQAPEWLAEDAWVIVQIHPREMNEVDLASLAEFDRRQYGSTLLLFYAPHTITAEPLSTDS